MIRGFANRQDVYEADQDLVSQTKSKAHANSFFRVRLAGEG